MRSPDQSKMEGRIASVARDVEPLLDEFVFAGGVVTSLLITDPAVSHRYPILPWAPLDTTILLRG